MCPVDEGADMTVIGITWLLLGSLQQQELTWQPKAAVIDEITPSANPVNVRTQKQTN